MFFLAKWNAAATKHKKRYLSWSNNNTVLHKINNKEHLKWEDEVGRNNMYECY